MTTARGTVALIFLLVLAAPGRARAQDDTLALSLERALELARRNNPGFLATANDMDVADWEVRSAYGQLFPTASIGGGISWQGAGEQRFGSLTAGELGFANQPSFYFSNYNVGLGYRLDGSTLLAPSRARASRARTQAQVDAAAVNLDQQVTMAYLDALRQSEGVTLTTQELERARFNLRLARAQAQVGTVTVLDVQQAELQVGRARVALLQAENAARTARLRLLQAMGIPLMRPVQLTSTFDVAEPAWSEEELYDRALDLNPNLRALRSARSVSDIQVDVAKSAYWPSLSLSAGVSGFTREASSADYLIRQSQAQVASQITSCQFQNELYRRLADPLPPMDCSRYAFTDEMRRAIVEQNDQFPFSFERSPPSASLSISLPIFQGLGRQLQVESAQAALSDAELQLREQEVALRADIAVGLDRVRTAYQSALIEEQNQAYADEQLRLAGERYRVGTFSFLDLVEAETVKAQADRERLSAIFAYHEAIASLEALVGGTLDGVGGTPGNP